MKKNFLKIALLSVIACGMPATFTSCDDDGWKSRCDTLEVKSDDVAKLIEQLSNQVKTLETQIAQNKQDAATAQKAADAAMAAAQAAQKAGDDAMAAAKTADAAAKAAAAAAAEAKAEAAAALKAQYEELIALINANKAELAAQKALIEGNAALIAQYKNLIDGNTVKINDNAGAIAKILEELKKYATSDQLAAQDEALKALIDALDKKLEAAGTNAQTAIEGLNNSVAGLQTALEVLNGKSEALGVQVSDLKKQVTESLGTLEANLTAQIAAEAALRAQGDKALQDQIDALKKDLAALNIASNLESFTKFISETETQLAALKKYDEALEKKIGQNAAGIEAANKLIADNKAKIATLEASLKAAQEKAEANAAAIAAQAALINKNADAIAKNAGDIASNADAIAKLQDAIAKLNNETVADLQNSVTDLQNYVNELDVLLVGISNQLADLTPYIITMTMEQLRGLVFIPNTFVGGIESALSYHMDYYPYVNTDYTSTVVHYGSSLTETVNLYNRNAYTFTYKRVDGVAVNRTFDPATEISYHMNPASASVKFEDLSLLSNDAEIISRSSAAGLALDPTYNEGNGFSIEDGVLTVAINGSTKEYAAQNIQKMPVFALKANVDFVDAEGKEQQTSVVSDYAMFAQSNVQAQAIEINAPGYISEFGAAQARLSTNVRRVYPSAFNAIVTSFNEFTGEDAQNYQFVRSNLSQLAKIAWDSKGVDLNKLFQITYWDYTHSEQRVWTSADEWSKFNISLSFKLVDYSFGTTPDGQYTPAKDGEQTWAHISEDGILTPCVNGDPKVQSKDELGHRPVVMVTASVKNVDENGKEVNEVILYGFVNILIGAEDPYYVAKTSDFAAVDFTCADINEQGEITKIGDGESAVYNSLYQNILAATDMNGAMFIKNYTPDLTTNGDFVQYVAVTAEGSLTTFTERTKPVGEITLVSKLAAKTVDTPYLNWAIDVTDKQVIYENNKNHNITLYVRFASNDENVYPDVYVPLTRTVNAKATASVGTKMEARWFRNLTTGLLNVQQPTNNFQPTTIATDLNLLWQGSKPAFTQTAGMPANYVNNLKATYANQNGLNGGYKYYFPAEQPKIDGITYTVANKTNPCLTGDKSLANSAMGDHALMVVKNGAFVANAEYNNTVLKANGKDLATIDPVTGVITLAENADAQKLLNKYASDGDGLNRTNAKLMVNVAVVAYNECGIALQLSENVIPAVFLRPINITEADKILDFTDAVANGSKVPVYSLLDFSDWRSVAFAGQEWLFAYYNVKSVKVNLNKMTTNAGTINSDPNKFVVDQSVIEAFSIEQPTGNIDYTGLINSGSNNAVKTKVSAAFGNIVYDNTKLNVKAFDVIIPMTINYGLGSFDVNVKCHVKATL